MSAGAQSGGGRLQSGQVDPGGSGRRQSAVAPVAAGGSRAGQPRSSCAGGAPKSSAAQFTIANASGHQGYDCGARTRVSADWGGRMRTGAFLGGTPGSAREAWQ